MTNNTEKESQIMGIPSTLQTLNAQISSEQVIDPRLPPFNYNDSDNMETRTSSLQAAFDAANASKKPILLSGYFYIDSLIISDHTDYTVLGNSALICQGSGGSTSAGLTLLNCTGLKWIGHHIVSVNSNFDYGVHVYSNTVGGTSLLTLEISVVNARTAWFFGAIGEEDRLVSEIVVRSGYTHNCRHGVLVYGTQAVIEFNGYQLIVVDANIGTNLVGIGSVFGGLLHVNGGEQQMPASPSGWGYTLGPINSPSFDNSYGAVYLNGVAIECAGLWCLMYNPNSVPNIKAGSGTFSMSNSTGYASFPGANIQASTSFSGKIVIDKTCDFHRGSVKSSPTVTAPGSNCDIYIDDAAFDSNFPTMFNAVSGGILHYSHRNIFTATNLMGQNLPASSATILKFKNIEPIDGNAYYYNCYSANTGVFTVPAGGLKSVTIHVEADFLAARPNSEFIVLKNGAIQIGRVGVYGRYTSNTFYLGDLPAGTTIALRFQNMDTSFSVGSTYTDYMTISAAN